MKNNNSKTRFWSVLLTVNILALLYPTALLSGGQDDGTRLFAILVLMVGVILLAAGDIVSIVFAYWDMIDEAA